MYKIIGFLFLSISFLLISCGDNNESDNSNCNNSCKDWEYCDADRDKCRLNEGSCNETIDCIRANDVCKENKCITPVVCGDWQDYDEATNTCLFKEGRCNTNLECTSSDQHCKTETHECVDNFTIEWTNDCPSYLHENAQCATVKLPMDYNKPDGKTMDVFIFRHLSKSNNVKGQIWFLQGGPGGSGSVFSNLFETYLNRYPDYDYYSLDHRGVANSSRLTCAKEATMTNMMDFASCIDELDTNLGDDLHEYSTTNSAKDVAFLLNALKENNKKRFVYGVSYGTYWAERYLTIFPEQADGVVLDSICTLGNCYMDDYSYWTDIVGKQFMDVCAEDVTCKAKMDTINPAGTKEAMLTVLNKMNASPCDFGFGPFRKADIQGVLGGMLRDWYARRFIPPVLYRLNRCEQKDKDALRKLVSTMYGMGKKYVTQAEMEDNNVLYFNIVFSELWFGRSSQYITDVYNNSLFNTGTGMEMWNMKNSNSWNEYTDEYIAQTTPETNTPVLMLNGTLDPQTALEIAVPSKEFLNKSNQYFITFPETPHGVTFNSVTFNSLMGQGGSCGEKIMFQFIDDTTKEPSKSCINDMILMEWSSNSQMNSYMSNNFMGTSDMWDGTPSTKKSVTVSPKFTKTMKESLERTRNSYYDNPELLKLIEKIRNKIK